jgi:hypothetical protein
VAAAARRPAAAAVAPLPLATGAAILRYRLYDLDALTAELLAVVDSTIQPTRAWLWLRPQGPSTAASEAVARQLPGRV